MTSRQWLLITFVVILNIIIFGALFGPPTVSQKSTPTPTWTVYPTFTPIPQPTATAILMPTLPPTPTSSLPSLTTQVHTVQEGETLESIAQAYDLSTFVLRMVNRLPDDAVVRPGQQLVIPATEP
jgi:LysM repeat protein